MAAASGGAAVAEAPTGAETVAPEGEEAELVQTFNVVVGSGKTLLGHLRSVARAPHLEETDGKSVESRAALAATRGGPFETRRRWILHT